MTASVGCSGPGQAGDWGGTHRPGAACQASRGPAELAAGGGARGQRRDRVGGRHRHRGGGRDVSRGRPVFTARAGRAGRVRGAVSMALGEYVPVSSSATASRGDGQEKRELADTPEADCRADRPVRSRGLSAAIARTVAAELTARAPWPLTSALGAPGEAGRSGGRVPRAPCRRWSLTAGGRSVSRSCRLLRAARQQCFAARCCGSSSAARSAWPSPTASGTCSAPPIGQRSPGAGRQAAG